MGRWRERVLMGRWRERVLIGKWRECVLMGRWREHVLMGRQVEGARPDWENILISKHVGELAIERAIH